jgi:hypothetical protein
MEMIIPRSMSFVVITYSNNNTAEKNRKFFRMLCHLQMMMQGSCIKASLVMRHNVSCTTPKPSSSHLGKNHQSPHGR